MADVEREPFILVRPYLFVVEDIKRNRASGDPGAAVGTIVLTIVLTVMVLASIGGLVALMVFLIHNAPTATTIGLAIIGVLVGFAALLWRVGAPGSGDVEQAKARRRTEYGSW